MSSAIHDRKVPRTTSMSPGSPALVSMATPATTHPDAPPDDVTTCRHSPMNVSSASVAEAPAAARW